MPPLPPKAAPDDPAGVALRIALALLALAAAAAAWIPGTWAWGLGALRFADPAIAWPLWAAAALALIPALGARLAPAFRAAGEGIARGDARATLACAAAAATLVALLPDRAFFTGDQLLRLGAADVLRDPRVLTPGGPGQFLPLDVLLHYGLPRLLATARVMDATATARALGAIEAALLALAALGAARAFGFRGVAAATATAAIVFGGHLALFTGFGKSFAEMCLVTAAVGALGARALREGRGLLPLGLALGAGLLLHRTAFLLLPAAALVWVLSLRGGAGGARRFRPADLLGMALPIAIAAWMLPRVIETVRRLDLGQNLAAVVPPAVRAADIGNIVLFTAPLVLPALAALPARGRPRGSEAALIATLLAPFLLLLVAVRPPQGLYRDWDGLAAGGGALSVAGGWAIGGFLRARARARGAGRGGRARGGLPGARVARARARHRAQHCPRRGVRARAPAPPRPRARGHLGLPRHPAVRARRVRRRGRGVRPGGRDRAQPPAAQHAGRGGGARRARARGAGRVPALGGAGSAGAPHLDRARAGLAATGGSRRGPARARGGGPARPRGPLGPLGAGGAGRVSGGADASCAGGFGGPESG